MRTIKFRAWNKKLVGMIDLKGYGEFSDFNSLFLDPDLEYMQYTGLKDKNGKEIYEGDIVGEESVYHFIEREGWKPDTGKWKIIGEKTKNFTRKREEKYIAGYKLSVVEWEQESCGFEPFSDSFDNCHHCGGGRRSTDFEIIGNIYESPELLNI